MNLSDLSLAAATLCTGLMAGLFFSFSCSVMPALKGVPDKEFITTMQSINRAIQNPVFFIVFFGCLLLLPASAYLNYSSTAPPVFRLALAATVIYFIGVFGVTVFGNIPLNNALDKFNMDGASAEMITQQRVAFEARWKSLNTIRTASSILSFALLILACINNFRTRHLP